MNERLWKYLEQTDRSYTRLMTFIYIVNIVINTFTLLWTIFHHFSPGPSSLKLDDVHAAMAVMYISMNFLMVRDIRRRRDEYNRSYLLICYCILVTIDAVIEQVIVSLLISGTMMPLHVFFSRSNILYLIATMMTVTVYSARHLALKRKYQMMPTRRKDV